MQHFNTTEILTHYIKIPKNGQKGVNWGGEKGEV